MSSKTSDPLNGREPARPALKTLSANQRALLDADTGTLGCGLREGFDHRRQVIEWYQAATVRTLGYLDDYWPPHRLANDYALLAALISGPARRNWLDDETLAALGDIDAWATEQRRELESQTLLPACNDAYTYLRKRAGEYIDKPNDSTVGDPERQEHVAMRPGFQEKDLEQRAALRKLWGGFKDRDALMDWLHWLNAPTYGEIDASTPQELGLDPVATTHLVGDDVDALAARRYRERFAIGVEYGDDRVGLLPAFAAGITAMNAGELASTTSGGSNNVPPG